MSSGARYNFARERPRAQLPLRRGLRVQLEEDDEIWLTGVIPAKPRGYTAGSQPVPIRPEAMATLKPGLN